ncbi:MAG: hypothetical protein R2881_07590 [Eubacteriales bacterium]
MDRIILHCDCNSYFASVESINRPELKSVPMAVAEIPIADTSFSPKRTRKTVRSQTAETIWQAKNKCPSLTLVPAHHKLYVEYSKKINQIYEEYSDLVEPFSIDESWLDVTATTFKFGTGQEIADKLRARMREEIGITIPSAYRSIRYLPSWEAIIKPDATTADH